MKSKRNSVEYSYLHTKERLLERYDLEISRKEYDNLNQIILHLPPAKFEEDANEMQGIFYKNFKGKEVIFVYSFTLGWIKTVLPNEDRKI